MSEPTEIDKAFREICELEVPLSERLEAFSEAVRVHALPFAEAYDELVARLRSGEAGATAPEPGEPMPGFALADSDGRVHFMQEMLEQGPLVISLNRGHWCEYCGIELAALRQALGEFAALGAQVVSIMPDGREAIAKAQAGSNGAYRVLSDESNGYALLLNLVIWVGERVRKLYMEHGVRLDYFQGNDAWFLPIPATFVVAQDGTIAARFVDPDFRRRMDVEAILRALTSLRS